jgi:hypothetical protein
VREDFGTFENPVLGNLLVPFLQRDLDLGPGQVRSGTAVLAGPERDVMRCRWGSGPTTAGSSITSGSRVANWMDNSTMSPFFVGQPWKSTSWVTFRAMLTMG